MQINKLKNYFSLKIISFTGYLAIPVWVYMFINSFPKTRPENFVGYSWAVSYLIFNSIFFMFITLLLLLFLIEFIIKKIAKKHKPLTTKINLIYTSLFFIGIILVILPLIALAAFFLLN